MHPYYGVHHSSNAVPTTVEHVELLDSAQQFNTLPNDQPTQNHGEIDSLTDWGDIASLPTASEFPDSLRTPIPTTSAQEMNNLGANFNFPSPQPQYGMASGASNGQNFQFLNPTFSGPPVQMMAPACGNMAVWKHTIPSTMPWTTSSNNSCGQFKFTATPLSTAVATTVAAVSAGMASCSPVPGTSKNRSLANGHHSGKYPRKHKRKAVSFPEHAQEESTPPGAKVFVNEARMAERLEQLQLDNNNLHWHPNLEEDWCSRRPSQPHSSIQDIDSRLSVSEDEEEMEGGPSSKNGETPQLEISEILKLGLKTKEMLPQVLLNEMNKPCMQVVLWKPPGDFVHDVIKNVTEPPSVQDEGCTTTDNIAANGDNMDVQDLSASFIDSCNFIQPPNSSILSPPIWSMGSGKGSSFPEDDDSSMDL